MMRVLCAVWAAAGVLACSCGSSITDDALAGTDKSQCAVDTDHYFTTPGARSEKADIIARWIAKRWR